MNPVLVNQWRGNAIECRYRGAVAVMESSGRVFSSLGDIQRAVFPRSAIKFLQAMPFVQSGAVEAFGLDERHIALACASHNGEPIHVGLAQDWLHKIGLEHDDLECGAELPMHKATQFELMSEGRGPQRLHHNCSGKRAIPSIAMPLQRIALAMARFGDLSTLDDSQRLAAQRIQEAVAQHPYLVAGKERLCTDLMQILSPGILVKVGAAGVYTAVIPEHGLGVAIKIDDGHDGAARVAMGAVLNQLGVLPSDKARELAEYFMPSINNSRGETIGRIEPSSDWQSATA